MILVDTSVWIDVFRIHNPLRLDEIIEFEQIVSCLPVIQEVLQGFRDERAFRLAHDALLALPIVEAPISISVIEEAIALYRAARRQGLTIRSSVDCLIAACALRNNLIILHRDRDYPLLAKISPLQQRQI
jgi:predicted nucleic acid-binding protein